MTEGLEGLDCPAMRTAPTGLQKGEVPLRQGHHLGRLARQQLAVRLHPGGPNPIMTLVAHSSRASGAGLSLPTGGLSCPNVGLPASANSRPVSTVVSPRPWWPVRGR